MSRQITLVFQTDEWHSHSSKVLIAACTSKKRAISTIKKFVKEEYKGKLDEDDVYNLNHINQTQSSSDNINGFEGEFVIEEITLNEIQ